MPVVDPDARGLGAGRALTEACVARARRDRAPEIALHTSPIMTVALPMYLRMGFVRVRDAPPLFGVPYAIYVKRWRQLGVFRSTAYSTSAGRWRRVPMRDRATICASARSIDESRIAGHLASGESS